MFASHYSHSWIIPLPPKQVWKLFSKAFENSKQVPEWPHRYSEILGPFENLCPKTEIKVTYKVGPLKMMEPYQIQEVIHESRIVYVPAEDHPLSGKSEIDFSAVGSRTQIHWHGVYEPKSFSSLASILFFKLYFERHFFAYLEAHTRRLAKLKRSNALAA